ncbi:protein kinase [Acidianus sulfidivorans JP7]|uniref:Protein kinase domain-containing protein n=1 Tax=Acidianus sulfidivorans JP7 TaxID=619593 RepID=A0A2U9IK29_9CREN|nr:protein kinase [Acidianus sulfidivorans]AWR96370.1 protein kinase [Acidianus sulfidivorans JP7]
MKIGSRIILSMRILFVIFTLLVGYLLLQQNNYLNSFLSSTSNYSYDRVVNFIIIESMLIYSLFLSIRPTLKSLGAAFILASLIIPTLFPPVFNTQILPYQVSLLMYIIFVAITVITIPLFGFFGGGIKSRIIGALFSILIEGVLLQYSMFNLSSFSQLTSKIPYLSLSFGDNFLIYSITTSTIGYVLLNWKSNSSSFNSLRNVGIPYFLVSMIPGLFYLMIYDSTISISSLLKGFSIGIAVLSVIIVDLVILIISILFNFKRDIEASFISSISSAIISLIFLLISPIISLEYLMSGAVVIPKGVEDPIKIEKDLFEALSQGKFNKANLYLRNLNKLGYSTTRIYCNAVNKRECDAVIWLPSKGKIDYLYCSNLKNAADCIIAKEKIPADVIGLLKALSQRDKDAAERLAGFVISKSGDKSLRDQVKALLPSIMGIQQTQPVVQKVALPSLEDWKPELWLNKQIYGYNILQVLGVGGTSYVLLGERDNGKYAIKIPKLTSSKDAKESFTTFVDISKESSKLQEISEKSNNIVKLYGIFTDVNLIKSITMGRNVELYYQNPPAIIMEYMSGGTAEDLLKNDVIYLSSHWKKIVTIISLNIAKAIKTIHDQNYVHLDIKPSNIFFSSFPGKFGEEVLKNLSSKAVSVKLGDLGSARSVGERFMEYTPQYCGVDQVKAMLFGGGAQKSMDIYAFGSTIYKLLTREPYNTPALIEYLDKSVEYYLSGNQQYKIYIQSAESEYVKYYQTVKIQDFDFNNLIKSMTNPDPLKRPNIDSVILQLDSILKKMNY